jgi:amidophosphoribosyltransferase
LQRAATFHEKDYETPEESKLMAATHTMEEMAAAIGVDSLAFISFDGLYRALGHESRAEGSGRYCDACFTGDYPITLVDKEGNLVS